MNQPTPTDSSKSVPARRRIFKRKDLHSPSAGDIASEKRHASVFLRLPFALKALFVAYFIKV